MRFPVVQKTDVWIFQPLAAVILAMLGISAAEAQYFPNDKTSCRSCHDNPGRATDFCDLFQAQVFDNDDKHTRAFYLLHESNDPERRDAKQALVRQILGFDLKEAFENDRYETLKTPSDDPNPSNEEKNLRHKVNTVKACLRCHATWPKSNDPDLAHQAPVPLEQGVTCQACHGPGRRWEEAHRFDPVWRAITPEAKASLGFYDVRSPEKKAQLCASCHVGDLEQGKFVTHQWYAGGHPPLPSFELANFQRQMPVHWKPLKEKKEFKYRREMLVRDERTVAAAIRYYTEDARGPKLPIAAIKSNYVEANFGSPDSKAENDLTQSRDAIVGGAAVLEKYVRLIENFTKQAGGGKTADGESKPAWPELALYDCTACHHELRSGLGLNDRPQRNHIPGRPPLAAWPTVLTKLAAHQAAGFDEMQSKKNWADIEKLMQKLDEAATKKPFGEPKGMEAAASDLAAALEKLAFDAKRSSFNEDAAHSAVKFLAEPKNYETRDFYAARQAAWAIRECSDYLKLPEGDRPLLPGAIGPLALELPSGPNRSVMKNLDVWLPAAAEYNPRWFQNELQAARDKLRMQ